MPQEQPAPAMADQLRKQLAEVGRRLDAADKRGATYTEVYRLVVQENALRADLERLGGTGT